MTTQKERQRLLELVNEGDVAGDQIEDMIRRIAREMPHLTVADLKIHEEKLRRDASS
jgi:hypothetical protein